MVLMNTGRTVFSQLMDDLPTYEFLLPQQNLWVHGGSGSRPSV